MKRIACILLLLPVLLLSACRGEPPTVKDAFTLSFTVSQDDVDYAGILDRTEDSLTVTMTAPYTVRGTAFCYRDGGLSIDYAAHSTQANCDYLPSKSIPTVLYNASAYLSQAVYTESRDGEDHFTLPSPYGDTQLTVADGIPVQLCDPYSGLSFSFDIPS